ncbi:hypothetical protein PQ796_30790 (plasmid) [Priestia megaterium]|jgi:hypothetical protein|uniref:hypothetical protein n=1 Tax=Priestia megaterium TaxID=1404 RepID=UPI00244A1E8E|nr:hypothetical protein [Priestia megaterium]MDH2454866.1 hypothetical protein [Priestia megaterium]MDL5154322.1 hypothetical protein [Priestia megaterium]
MKLAATLGISSAAATAILVAVLAGSAIALGPIWAARIYMYFLRTGWSPTVIW